MSAVSRPGGVGDNRQPKSAPVAKDGIKRANDHGGPRLLHVTTARLLAAGQPGIPSLIYQPRTHLFPADTEGSRPSSWAARSDCAPCLFEPAAQRKIRNRHGTASPSAITKADTLVVDYHRNRRLKSFVDLYRTPHSDKGCMWWSASDDRRRQEASGRNDRWKTRRPRRPRGRHEDLGRSKGTISPFAETLVENFTVSFQLEHVSGCKHNAC